MPSNSNVFSDQFGNTPDWLELYNKGDTTIDLAGYALSDDHDEPIKWVCGSQLIKPKSFAIICASGNSITTYTPETSDIIDLSNAGIAAWADSQNVIKGNSHIRPAVFPGKVYSDSAGRRMISAHMYLDDNAGIINWQTAEITADFRSTKNYTTYDFLRIIGTIQKGKYLMVRVCQLSVENWQTYGKLIVGTGKENDVYDIPLSTNLV
jgi:hypothetical protein